MESLIQTFQADFSDQTLTLYGELYPIGTLAVELLNRRDLYEAALSMRQEADVLSEFVKEDAFHADDLPLLRSAVFHILHQFEALKPLQIFLTPEQLDSLWALFDTETDQVIRARDAQIGRLTNPTSMTEEELNKQYPILQNPIYPIAQGNMIHAIHSVGRMLLRLPGDVCLLYDMFSAAADAYSCDEKHTKEMLMRLASEHVDANSVENIVHYVPMQEQKKKKPVFSIGRRIRFRGYVDLVFTDFYEGLRCGHYPRKCVICGRYFLVTSGHEQKICDGYTTVKRPDGQFYTCHQYARRKREKEPAEANPVKQIYDRTMDLIRHDVSRSILTPEQAKTAKSLAKEHKQHALWDPVYAADAYAKDMQKTRLYQTAQAQQGG